MPLPNPGEPVEANLASRNNQQTAAEPRDQLNSPSIAASAAPAAARGSSAPSAPVNPVESGPVVGERAGPDTSAARRGLKGAGTTYTPAELGETLEQWGAIQNRLEFEPAATICRTCFHNCGNMSRRWCSRFGNESAGVQACERCERCESLPKSPLTRIPRESLKEAMYPLDCLLRRQIRLGGNENLMLFCTWSARYANILGYKGGSHV